MLTKVTELLVFPVFGRGCYLGLVLPPHLRATQLSSWRHAAAHRRHLMELQPRLASALGGAVTQLQVSPATLLEVIQRCVGGMAI